MSTTPGNQTFTGGKIICTINIDIRGETPKNIA